MKKIIFLFLVLFFQVTAMAEPMALYYSPRSSSSLRVRLALAYKGVPYEPIKVSGATLRTKAFREINPNGRVPCLCSDEYKIHQSVAIIEFLEERYPDPPLLPKDPHQRAQVRAFVQLVGSDIQPLQSQGTLQRLPHVQRQPWTHYWISRGLAALELMALESAGTCCIGDSITMADLFLLPQLENARLYNIDLHTYPKLLEIESYLKRQEVFSDLLASP